MIEVGTIILLEQNLQICLITIHTQIYLAKMLSLRAGLTKTTAEPGKHIWAPLYAALSGEQARKQKTFTVAAPEQ